MEFVDVRHDFVKREFDYRDVSLLVLWVQRDVKVFVSILDPCMLNGDIVEEDITKNILGVRPMKRLKGVVEALLLLGACQFAMGDLNFFGIKVDVTNSLRHHLDH